MSDLTAHYAEELIKTLQGLYNRKTNFTWMEARPLLAQLLEQFRTECAMEEVKRLQDALHRYEWRDAVDGKNGAALRMADAERVKN